MVFEELKARKVVWHVGQGRLPSMDAAQEFVGDFGMYFCAEVRRQCEGALIESPMEISAQCDPVTSEVQAAVHARLDVSSLDVRQAIA